MLILPRDVLNIQVQTYTAWTVIAQNICTLFIVVANTKAANSEKSPVLIIKLRVWENLLIVIISVLPM